MGRPHADIVEQAIQLNVAMAADGANVCWAKCFIAMLTAVDPSSGENAKNLRSIPVQTWHTRLQASWQMRVWLGWVDGARGRALRAIPDDETRGMKLATFNQWFRVLELPKGQGFAYHLNCYDQIRAVARFKMSAHDLNIETMRRLHGNDRIPRNARTCQCCNAGAREDELHIFECEAYTALRAAYTDIIPGYPDLHDPDTWMRQTMNPSSDFRANWTRWADFLIKAMVVREAEIAGPHT